MLDKYHTIYFLFYKQIKSHQKRFSKLTVNLAISGIAVGILVMLSASAIVNGFQKEIPNRLVSFWGHIQVSRLDNGFSFESVAIPHDKQLIKILSETPGVTYVRSFATKPGIAKTEDTFEGIIMKGVGQDFDFKLFAKENPFVGNSLKLDLEEPSLGVMISKVLAKKLQIKVGDTLPVFFVQNPPRVRQFWVSAIYSNPTEQEGGKSFILADIRHLAKINNWNEGSIGGYEIGISTLDELSMMDESIRQLLPMNLETLTVAEQFPQLFSWLSLFDINERVILTIMLLVAGINVVSAILILILERVSMIGTLLALGMKKSAIKGVFQLMAMRIVFLGLLIGNSLTAMLYFSQRRLKYLKLPEESYYLSFVPMELSIEEVLLLNAGTVVACFVLVSLASVVISGINPIKSIKFR